MPVTKVVPVEEHSDNDANSTSIAPKSPSYANHVDEDEEQSGCPGIFRNRTRFLLMVLVLLCLASIWSNILAFNFALICFLKHPSAETSATSSALNSTMNEEVIREATQFTAKERSILTSAVAASALVANFVVVALVNRFGIRTIFATCGLISAIATLFLPTAIYSGFYYTLAARCFQGIAFASNFPAIGAFTMKYSYFKQSGLFVSVLVAYVQLSPALTMPISGQLCESSMKWPSVFYAHGGTGLLLFALFALFYRNSPNKHPYVGNVELNKIAIGKSTLSKKEQRNIPYGAILKTVSVWAIWIAAIGNFTTVNMLFLYSPTYMNRVLHFPVHSSGISSALAPLAQFCLKLFAGWTSDKVQFLGETNKLRAYNSVAFFGSAICMVVLAFFPTTLPYVCLFLFGASAGTLGFTTGGFFKAGPMVSKQYSHFVVGNISLGITITMLVVPFMVNGLAPNSTPEEWRYVFLCTAATLIVTNLLFTLMCSAEPAYWTTESFSREASANTKTSSVISTRTAVPRSTANA
ncbi:hypothetical protein M3Y95_00031600 [Aphelenchoides besseyi]|nr:hypothetical protein M3Y95_00031600 [Aphelenchoides besseyi]